MINVFKIKKWAALALAGMLPAFFFVMGAQFYGFLVGVGTMLVGLILGVFIGNALLKNPFSDLLEGKGLLALDVNSTGVITPFIVNIVSNQIKFKDPKSKEDIDELFDREAVHMLNVPKQLAKSKVLVDNKAGVFTMTLDQDEFNSSRFSLFQYPVLLYNSLLKTILTKEMLSDNEKEAYAEHGLIHLNHQIRGLNNNLRDFARGVVESLKPKQNIFSQWWFYLIIGIVVITLIALFAPAVLNAISGLGGGAASQAIQTAGSAASGGAITPLG